jgi:hypothetical protein
MNRARISRMFNLFGDGVVTTISGQALTKPPKQVPNHSGAGLLAIEKGEARGLSNLTEQEEGH